MKDGASPAGATLDLRDIHLPAEPSWWPPAIGWWVLTALALVAVWYAGRWLLTRARRRRRLKMLLAELQHIEQTHPLDQASQRLTAYSDLLRRACRRFAPAALALSGEAWLEFLDSDDGDQPFSMGAGRILLHGPFQPTVEPQQVAPLADLIRHRLTTLAEHVDA
ncbi:MAG: DUF4381 domain-containing protein [Pseudomarimonas sp.]